MLNNRIKEESSRIISLLLVAALEACRQGEVELVEQFGLSIDSMRNLDQLKADEILRLANLYMRDICAMDIFCLDGQKLERLVNAAIEERKENALIDEYLQRGACKGMMEELFGLRSTQIANRKKFLNIPSVRGRLSVITVEEERKIYYSWLEHLKPKPDYRERMLAVAKETELPLSKVYRVIKVVEEVKNQERERLNTSTRRICA